MPIPLWNGKIDIYNTGSYATILTLNLYGCTSFLQMVAFRKQSNEAFLLLFIMFRTLKCPQLLRL